MADGTLGPYRLEELIGRGGMGEVWRAYDTRRRRRVALKRLTTASGDDGEFLERFRREAETTAGLASVHVVPIHDWGEIDGEPFLDMRLIDAGDLAAVLDAAGGTLRPDRAVRIVGQLADALDTAHGAGIVHRDVKPSNVLVAATHDGDHCYLVDFGIAKVLGETLDRSARLTRSASTLGTPYYMAPELFGSATSASARSDVYALGATLYRMLTGHEPFEGPGVAAVMQHHLVTPPPRPSATDPRLVAFDPVIATALAKDPGDRPPSCGALALAAARALRPTAPDDAVTLWPPWALADDPDEVPPSPARRRGPWLVLAAVLVLLLAAGTTWLTRSSTPAAPPAAAPPPVLPRALITGRTVDLPDTGATDVHSAADVIEAFRRWPDACTLLTRDEIAAAVPGASIGDGIGQHSSLSFDDRRIGRTPNAVTCLWPVRGATGGTAFLRLALRTVGGVDDTTYEDTAAQDEPTMTPTATPDPPPDDVLQPFPDDGAFAGLTTTRCGARQLDRSSYDADPEGIYVTPPGDVAQVLCLHAPQVLYDIGWQLAPNPPVPAHEWVDQSIPALVRVLDATIR